MVMERRWRRERSLRRRFWWKRWDPWGDGQDGVSRGTILIKSLCVHARWPCWPQLLGPRCFQNTWSMKSSEGMFCLKWLNPALSYNTICSEIDSLKMGVQGTSPVVQWLGVCLPVQGKQVQSLVLEDPTFCAAAKPVSCSRWAGVLQPEARSKRGHHSEKPSHRSSDTAQPVF